MQFEIIKTKQPLSYKTSDADTISHITQVHQEVNCTVEMLDGFTQSQIDDLKVWEYAGVSIEPIKQQHEQDKMDVFVEQVLETEAKVQSSELPEDNQPQLNITEADTQINMTTDQSKAESHETAEISLNTSFELIMKSEYDLTKSELESIKRDFEEKTNELQAISQSLEDKTSELSSAQDKQEQLQAQYDDLFYKTNAVESDLSDNIEKLESDIATCKFIIG